MDNDINDAISQGLTVTIFPMGSEKFLVNKPVSFDNLTKIITGQIANSNVAFSIKVSAISYITAYKQP